MNLAPAVRTQLMQMQFAAQTASYSRQFPNARFDIIEFDGTSVGRIVVNRPGDALHVVDFAITPAFRNRGIGTAIMRALLAEASRFDLPVRLKVADGNDPAMGLYARLGFNVIETAPLYLELEWRADGVADPAGEL